MAKRADDARDTARWLDDAGRNSVLLAGDLTDPAHCREVINTAVDQFGSVDVLVSSATFQMTHESIEEIPDEEWDHRNPTAVIADHEPGWTTG